MEKQDIRNTGFARQLIILAVLMGLAAGILAGCEGPLVGGADDAGDTASDEATNDEGGGGDTDEEATDEEAGDEETTDTGSETLDTSNMVLHLGFDGNLSDETATSSNISVFGSSEIYGEDRAGGENGAIEFNGSYAVKVEDIDLSSADSLTVTAWVRDDGSQTEKDRWIASFISSEGESAGSYYEFAMRIRKLTEVSWEDGSFEAWVENSGTNGTRTTENVFPGTWVHVAMVYSHSDAELRLYQDGIRKNSTPVSLSVEAGNLVIGGGAGTSNDFYGRIDDLAVFTRALSDAEIALAQEQINTSD